ncbi:trithorax group protein osa isoform X2 [Thrips palmi]|uniref:Trithorax group protein osa isoform X2 n=1 Tax=Thrips palmi TaxID=161013 RepID=A0A6P8Z0P1_THRPL|nr:trithorax group protein osa isoform X2 [Thrips palmi]
MARLTEEMVVARTKQSDIGQVTKLNCCVNKIRSLEDFQHCRNLVELFVRKNEIADLNQILYLQHLPKLRNLWLEENPCANEDEYRYTVLRALPSLKTLDKVPVQPEEVQDAMRRGRDLTHPQDPQDSEYWEPQPQNDSQSPLRDCSPPPAAPVAYQPQRTEPQQAAPQQPPQHSPPAAEKQQPQQPLSEPPRTPQQPQAPDSTGAEDGRTGEESSASPSCPPARPSNSPPSTVSPAPQPNGPRRTVQAPVQSSTQQATQGLGPVPQSQGPVGQRSPPRCAVDTQGGTFTRKPSRDYIIRNADDMPVGGGGGQYYYEDGDLQYQRQPQNIPPQQYVYEDPPIEDEPPVVLRQPHRMSNGGYHDVLMNQGDNSSSDGSGGMYRERSRPVSTVEDDSRQTCERNNRQTHERLSSAAQRLANDRMTCNTNQRAPYPRRPITRSSNLLSAVLCLVKELDYPSLEVVEMAVKCRMDELED